MIFLSYRRSDEHGYVARLGDSLSRVFGNNAIFRDIDKLMPGRKWQDGLDDELGKSKIVLAVIGERWFGELKTKDEGYGDDNPDILRYELNRAKALNVPVLPVLLNSAQLPEKSSLGDLGWLCDLQAFNLRDGRNRWELDIDNLAIDISALSGMSGMSGMSGTQSRVKSKTPVFIASVTVPGLVAIVYLSGIFTETNPVDSTSLAGTHTNTLPMPLGELAHNWEGGNGLTLFLDAAAGSSQEQLLNNLQFPVASGNQQSLMDQFCAANAGCIECRTSPAGASIEDADLLTVSLSDDARLVELEMLTADRKNEWPIQDTYLPWENIDRETGKRSLFACAGEE